MQLEPLWTNIPERSLFYLFMYHLVSKMKDRELPSMWCVSSHSQWWRACLWNSGVAVKLQSLLQPILTKQWNNCHTSVSWMHTTVCSPFVERLYVLPLTDAWKEKLYRIHSVDLWGKVSSVWLQKLALYLQTMSNSSVSCLAGVHNVISTAVRNSSEIRCCTSFQENNWKNWTTSPKSMLTMVVTIHWKVWFRNKGFMVLLMVEKVYIKGRICQKQYMSGFLLSSLPLKTLLLNL